MKQKLLFLLTALMLLTTGNAWGGVTTLLNIDYSTTTTPAWTVIGGSGSIVDGAWKHVQGGGGGNRSAYLDFGVASSIDDNWTVEFDAALKPGSDRNDQQITVAGANTTYANNTSATGYMYFAVKEESNGGTTYTVKIGNTNVATGVTLSNGTTYHFKVEYDGSSAVTAYIGETKYEGTVAIANVGKLRGLHGCVARYNGAITYDNIVVTKEVNAENVSSPTIAVAYASANRTVTITPGVSSESNVVTTYYTLNGEDPTSSSSVYSTPLDIDADCTVKAISISSASVASEIVSQAVTVGKLTLATPTISATGFTNEGGQYVLNPTFNFACDNSGIEGQPVATLSYTFTPDGGSESSPVAASSFAPTTKGTLKVIASADNYYSSEKTLAVSNGYAISYSGRDYTTATHEDPISTWGPAYSVTWSGWASGLTAYLATTAVVDDYHLNIQNASTISLVEGWGWIRGDQKSYGYRVRHVAEGEFIALKENSSKGSDANATTYQTEYSNHGTGQTTDYVTINVAGSNLVQQLFHYSPAVVTEADIAIVDCKQHETSAAFAEAIDAQSFSTAEEVYAFHTAWQINNASSNEITKVIFDAQVSDFSRWNNARNNHDQQYDGAPDNKYFDAWSNETSDGKQKIYGLPAGTYTLKAATRASDDVADVDKYKVWVKGGSADVSVLGHHDGNTGGKLGNGWSWTTLSFTLDATADVEIGFYSCPPTERWTGCDDFHLYAEGVPASLGTNGYATFASPYALNLANLPEGLTAYKAAVEETTVTFTQVTDAVQANTGLLLKGTASGNYNIPVATSGADISATNAFLVNEGGKTFNADDNFNYFGLKKNTLTFGLFNPATVAIPSNKAYLKIANSGARLTIVFEDDDPTAINTVEAAESEADALKDGKYLINGKIVIVKNGVKYSANGQILK